MSSTALWEIRNKPLPNSHDRQTDTGTFLFAHGFRYRVNVRTLPGTPDIVLRRFKTAIFINGCFWHGHEGCRYYVLPKSNVEFWERKIERNRNRDAANHMRLRLMGWSVVQIWECQLKPRKRHDTLEGLLSILNRQVLHTYGEKEYDIAEPAEQIAAEEKTVYNTKQ